MSSTSPADRQGPHVDGNPHARRIDVRLLRARIAPLPLSLLDLR